MDQQKEKEIIDIMQQDKNLHVPFFQTKQQLISKGYTEADIVYALYSSPYDETSNTPKPPHPLQQLYEQDPVKAQQVAVSLLQDQRKQEWNETAADLAAGAAGLDIQSRSYYDVLAADRLGIPYFTLMFGGVVLLILGVKLNWSDTVMHTMQVIYGLSISLVFLYKLVQERSQINK